MVLIATSCTMSWTSLYCSSGTLSDLIPWIYFPLPVYNQRISFRAYLNGLVVFPTFSNFSLNLANKEFMIRATVSSWSCFCWLYRVFPSSAAKNVSIWFQYWPSGDVQIKSLLLCCWKRVFAMTSALSWQNSVTLCPASFCTPRPSLPVIPGTSSLPPFAFQSPIM